MGNDTAEVNVLNDDLQHLRRVALGGAAVFLGMALLLLIAGLTITEPIRALAFVASFFAAVVGGSLVFNVLRYKRRAAEHGSPEPGSR